MRIETEKLYTISLFKGVELPILEDLAARMQSVSYAADTVLFNEGDTSNAMYIILQGQIEIYTHGHDGTPMTLLYHGKNDLFGELSLIDGLARSASARAKDDVDVLVLYRDDFLDVLNKYPRFGIAMMVSLCQRVRTAANILREYESKTRAETVPRLRPTEMLDAYDVQHKAVDEANTASVQGIFERISTRMQDKLDEK